MPVDLSGELYAAFERGLARAKLRVSQGRLPEAAAAYRQCAADLERYAETVRTPTVRAGWLQRALGYRELADRLDSEAVAVPRPEGGADEDDYSEAVMALVHRSDVEWDDIAGLDDTKREIKAAYGLALARAPEGVELAGWRNILFYGPPGTGKTLLAAATSHGLDATFFNVKVSDMLSKYFGESTRLVSALYDAARRVAPAVIFLDEVEALTPPRDGVAGGPEARIVATLLAELDGLTAKGDERYVLTIAATNLPWLIDRAVLSRFEKLIYIPLPDALARRRILELEIDEKGLASEVALDDLVARMEGYSGREISQIVREAAKEMVATVNPDLVDAVDRGRDAVEDYALRTVPISAAQWDAAFTRILRRTGPDDLARYDAWRQRLT